MFASATLKMTAWYLLVLVAISLLFSVIIYQISTHELDDRLNVFQSRIERRLPPGNGGMSIGEVRENQATEAKATLFAALQYMNVVILGVGGVGSYFFARHTLKPIEESHEAEARFTSNASHELRTPLAVMKSEIEVALRDSNLTKQDMREILESNLEEVDRLSALSHTLLKLSRNQLTERDFAAVDITTVLTKVIATYKHDSHVFDSSISKQLTIERGNKSSLNELFMILLENACKYSPNTSTVKISAMSKSGKVIITFSNEGEGIAAQDLPRIFERFYRGDASHTNANGKHGYGLGLSLAKQIVSLHQGTIHIDSQPHKQTRVTVSLPKSAKSRSF